MAGSIWYDNPGNGLANFTFSGYDGGPSAADKGTGFYSDKSGYYTAKATDVEGIDSTSMKLTMEVTYSKHPAVKAGVMLTFIVNDAPDAPDYLTYRGHEASWPRPGTSSSANTDLTPPPTPHNGAAHIVPPRCAESLVGGSTAARSDSSALRR